MYASGVSAQPCVRAFLLDMQRELARTQNVVMDGRDIGTVVLPNAQVKIFLTADVRVRAERRLAELQAKGEKTSLQKVLAEMQARDKQDSERAAAPLRQAKDALLVDTTGNSLDESLDVLLETIKERLKA